MQNALVEIGGDFGPIVDRVSVGECVKVEVHYRLT